MAYYVHMVHKRGFGVIIAPHRAAGIGLVEIIILIAIIALSLIGAGQFVAFMQRAGERAANQKTAVFLAEEGVEALVSLKLATWAGNVATLTPGTVYYVTRNGSGPYTWQVLSMDPGALYGLPGDFRRSFVLSRVYRDSSDNIASTGTEDVDMRQVIATVSWTERGQTQTFTASSYIANINRN